jgi:hypothetical protein
MLFNVGAPLSSAADPVPPVLLHKKEKDGAGSLLAQGVSFLFCQVIESFIFGANYYRKAQSRNHLFSLSIDSLEEQLSFRHNPSLPVVLKVSMLR